jgi:hypothetical protein
MARPSRISPHDADLAARLKSNVTVRMNPAVLALPATFELTAADLAEVAKPVDDKFRAMMAALYDSEGTSGGSRWKELSPSYLAQKARKWGSLSAMRKRLLFDAKSLPQHYLKGSFRPMLGEFKILQLTRRLRMSLTSRNSEHIMESGKGATGSYIMIGTTVPYAVAHWSGTTRLPSRNPFQRTEEQDRQLGAAVVDGLRNVLAVKIARLAGASA